MAEREASGRARATVRARHLTFVLAELMGIDMTHQDGRGFSLTVTVPADDYADLERRLVFLEAVAVQLLRERCRIREWFTAADLQALALPGLPTARNAITRAARKQGWALRKVRVKGGLRHEYHYTSLPRRAFDALIERVRRPSYAEIGAEPRAEIPSIPAFPQTVPASKNTAPAWVLPLVRLLRAKEGATLNQALARLPALLPSGMVGPTQAEAVAVLRAGGLVNALYPGEGGGREPPAASLERRMSFGISPVYTTLKPPKPGSNVLTLTVSMPWFSVELLIRKQVWDERGLLLPARHHVRLVGPRYLPQELIDGHPVERLWKALELWLGEIMRGQPGGGATRVAERERERQHWWACLLGLQSLVDETLTAYGLVTDGELYWNTLEDPRFSARSTLLWLCEMFKECEPSARLVAEQAFIVAFNDGLLLLKHPLRQWVPRVSVRSLKRWRADPEIREFYEHGRAKMARRCCEIEAEFRQRALDERAKLQRLEQGKLLLQRAKRGGRRRPW